MIDGNELLTDFIKALEIRSGKHDYKAKEYFSEIQGIQSKLDEHKKAILFIAQIIGKYKRGESLTRKESVYVVKIVDFKFDGDDWSYR